MRIDNNHCLLINDRNILWKFNFFSHLFMFPFKTETAVTKAVGNLFSTRNGNRITIFRVYFIQVSNYVLSKC